MQQHQDPDQMVPAGHQSQPYHQELPGQMQPPTKCSHQTGWRAKMVWMLAMYENHGMEAQVLILWDQLNNHMASSSGNPGRLQNYYQRKW